MDLITIPGTFDYGYWGVASILILLGGLIVLGFIRPKRALEWRSIGMFLVFFISLFAGMYGLPFAHVEDHLFTTLIDLGVPVAMTVWLAGSLLIFSGGYLVIRSWLLIRRGGDQLITEDLYQHIRHPQYLGLTLITVGMLIQWPTMLVVVMWAILVPTYFQLARREERIMETLHGKRYHHYREQTPMFFPTQMASVSGIHIVGDE